MLPSIITIDGPVGSGKGTVAHILAKELGFLHLDSGGLYRSLALYFFRNYGGLPEVSIMEKECVDVLLDVQQDGVGVRILLNGEVVNNFIYKNEISKLASQIAQYSFIRAKVDQVMKNLAKRTSLIVDGRDTGSDVFPEATMKFYLDATANIRAERRMKQLEEKGETRSFDLVLEETIARDKADTERTLHPLRIPKNALIIDSSHMSIEEVVTFMKSQYTSHTL